ncbi:acyl-CoA dehydrogenase [Nocardioides cynanchi]|uniref:acyl-CoA dehydrogenase n=1 Tax=Nocardioides cynanchi TaxID=2558918 RepID=UPI00192D6A70|nr:acyl-CoA dehydrogenase [Nocardioides cynanchi]
MPCEMVSLRRGQVGPLPRLAAEQAEVVTSDLQPDLDHVAKVAHDLGQWLPLPMQGDTLSLWESLASLGAVDLTVARVVEPHVDALSILREARREGAVPDEEWSRHWPGWSAAPLWGVYAAEGRERLRAVRGTDGSWCLEGVKPWCSLADRASHALITAWVDDEQRGLFAIDLSHPGVRVAVGDDEGAGQSSRWAARGLTQVRSTAIHLDAVPSVAIGPPQWYLARPGFAWGGVGVAAIWYGGAVALACRLRAAFEQRPPDQVALMHLGAVDTALTRARVVLQEAAQVADDPATSRAEAELVSQRARQVVADTVDEVLNRVGHALGPAPLTGEEEHARRVADLTVYVRQHHAERDLARLGQLSLDGPGGWQWW